MPTVTKTLVPVAEYLRENGWKQGGGVDSNGCCCMVTAMLRVLPAGEFELAIEPLVKNLTTWKRSDMKLSAARAESYAIVWNDAKGRVFREVEVALRHTSYVVEAPTDA